MIITTISINNLNLQIPKPLNIYTHLYTLMNKKEKIQKIVERIIKEDKAIFDSLLEFEQTKKIRSKTRLNFTIDKSIADKFRKYCRNNGYNMSAKIEMAMKKIAGT